MSLKSINGLKKRKPHPQLKTTIQNTLFEQLPSIGYFFKNKVTVQLLYGTNTAQKFLFIDECLTEIFHIG